MVKNLVLYVIIELDNKMQIIIRQWESKNYLQKLLRIKRKET